jgi:FdhD protein
MEPRLLQRPSLTVPCQGRGTAGLSQQTRVLPEETPLALVYGGSTEAVMMGTPADLEDFAVGFSLTEGLIAAPADIDELSVVHSEHGIELRMWLKERRQTAYRDRRRRLTGPTGCGLCGIESLAQAQRPAARVSSDTAFSPACVADAVAAVTGKQDLHRQTRAVHAAGFYQPDGRAIAVREDVGRHNALDKLAGALARSGTGSGTGAIVITSRVSVEMVQKAAAIGAPLLIAVSAPTALAVRTATAAGLTLAAVARGDSFEVFSHPWRITG